MRFAALVLLALSGSASLAGPLAIKGKTIYTMAGAPLVDGMVLVKNGKIERMGMDGKVRIPDGYEILEAKVVTPGFIDMRSIVGLSGAYNVDADQDQDEETGPDQAELRAIDAYNPDELLVDVVNRYGVTTMQVGPGRANVIAGQAAIVKSHGHTLREVLVRSPSAMIFNLGERPKSTYRRDNKEPTTRMASAAIIREGLMAARSYEEARKRAKKSDKAFARDLKKEGLLAVLNGEIPAMIMANRSDDIMTAIRIAKEFDIDLWLDNGAEAYLVADQIRAAGAPVVVHPAMQRPASFETLNTSLENPVFLRDKGVTLAFQTGTESYVPKTRILLFEAAMFRANGLTMEQTLQAMTMTPARIMKIDDRVGSIERGKDADLVLFDGDPFEYVTHVTAVVTGGEISHRR